MNLSPLLWSWALLVVAARQLFPSIDADTGSGALFVLAEFALGLLVLVHMLLQPGPSALVPAFVFFVALSTWTAAYRHPAVHMLGEWIGVLCVWAAVRRSASPSTLTRPALLVCVLAVGEAALTWRQVHSVIPELLAQYRRGDGGIMRDMHLAGVEPGFMFQARLEAGLPWGTFGHTNALAGFLLLGVPFLLALTVAVWSAPADARNWIARLLGVGLLLVLISALALTKCRSAWIGVLTSVGTMAVASPFLRALMIRRWPWLATGFAILVLGFIWKGGNSLESLKYRLEYWRGSLPIMQENPWLGIGWGSFRDHYLPHKLPESSEEIADPHNFFIELAAVAGIPAAIAYLGWLIATLVALFRNRVDEDVQTNPKPSVSAWIALTTIVLIAAGLIVILGFASSWTEIGGWEIVAAIFAVLALDRLAPSPNIQTWRIATAAALIGLHLHLLAAGGVGHPGMMLACWALAAAAGAFNPVTGWKRWLDMGLLSAVLFAGWIFGCFDLAVRTVERDPLLGRIRNGNALGEEAAGGLVDRVLRLTPGDADLWAEIARRHRRRLAESKDDAKSHYENARSALDRAIELQPLRSGFWHERATLTLEAAGRGLIPPQEASSAANDLGKALERYPNSPARQADEAVVLAAVGRETPTAAGIRESVDDWRTIKTSSTSTELGSRLGRRAAESLTLEARKRTAEAAEKALRLDAATPHYDKKLLPAERAWLQAVGNETERSRGPQE